MKYISLKLISAALLAAIMLSCVKDHMDGERSGGSEGIPVTLSLVSGTRMDIAGDRFAFLDYEVSTLRIIGYHTNSMELAFNKIATITSDNSNSQGIGNANPDIKWIAKTQVETGNYTIVFIANYDVDNDMDVILADDNQINTFAKLQDVSFSHESLQWNGRLPMIAVHENVQIIADNEVNVDGTPHTGTWPLSLDRLAVRVDLSLTLSNAVGTAWMDYSVNETNGEYRLLVYNVPRRMYLFEKINETPVIDKNYRAGDFFTGYQSFPGIINSGGFYDYDVAFPRIILPEYVMTNKADEDKAIEIGLGLRESGVVRMVRGKIGNDIILGDYSLTRNTYLTVNARVLEWSDLDMEIEVRDWDDQAIDGMIGDRRLSVSAIKGSINEHNMMRVYFTSNQKDVAILETTSEGLSVDDYFYGLIGETDAERYNFHYSYNQTTGEGSGWFDVMTDRDKDVFESRPYMWRGYNGTHGIQLYAGGQVREITVDVNITLNGYYLLYNFVGAFWRNDQTGERVIAGPNTGSWTAEVTAGADWIVLEYGKSLDPDLWGDGEPGDAENFQVTNGTNQISGEGNVYFRIGLTGKNTTGSPRYGVVTVHSTSADSYNIYVRQGEDPDYLMKPGDGSGNGTLSSRPLARKFSPFNLTSKEYLASAANQKTGGTTLNDHTQIDVERTLATFTEYPTQAGAYFQWASPTYPRYAWHSTYTAANIPWSASYENYNWDWDALNSVNNHETCPPGYRRPNTGSTSSGIGLNEVNYSDSETFQSLFFEPHTGTSGSIAGAAVGYYADGFFDRYELTRNDEYTGDYGHLSAVSVKDYRVAYIGALLFNPYDNRSLFFPATGYLEQNSGKLGSTGMYGYYYTTSAYRADLGWAFQVNVSSTYISRMATGPNTQGNSIRCVVDE